jgi:hypothetical protein
MAAVPAVASSTERWTLFAAAKLAEAASEAASEAAKDKNAMVVAAEKEARELAADQRAAAADARARERSDEAAKLGEFCEPEQDTPPLNSSPHVRGEKPQPDLASDQLRVRPTSVRQAAKAANEQMQRNTSKRSALQDPAKVHEHEHAAVEAATRTSASFSLH